MKSMHELIVDAVRSSPKGFTLDEAKTQHLIAVLGESAAKKDLEAAKAVYEMVAVLEKSNGAPAARSLLRLMIDGAELTARTLGNAWRSRT